MMPYFVCYHIGQGKVAGGPEGLGKLIGKTQVNVDRIIQRTIKRARDLFFAWLR
jgi:hypothetical protein